MNPLLALLAVLFTLSDPVSDSIGDGTLTPPTAAIYASNSVFDIHEFALHSSDDGELVVMLELGSLERDTTVPNGFRFLVADVYLDIAPGGENELRVPGQWVLEPSEGWEYFVQITPDGTYGLRPGDTYDEAEELLTEFHESQIMVYLPSDQRVAEEYDPYAYALTGLYDPFAPTMWRAVSDSVSPWSFSSNEALPTPVLDLTAPDFETQEFALENRIMPKERVVVLRSLGWIVLMLVGFLIALIGWVFRLQKRTPPLSGADEHVVIVVQDDPEGDVEIEVSVDGQADHVEEASEETELVIPFVERNE